jgi:hypothetical protein
VQMSRGLGRFRAQISYPTRTAVKPGMLSVSFGTNACLFISAALSALPAANHTLNVWLARWRGKPQQ